MTRRHTTLLVLAVAWFALPPLPACEIRVRDSAFRSIRDVHKLCVIADSSDETAEAIVQRLQQWLSLLSQVLA